MKGDGLAAGAPPKVPPTGCLVGCEAPAPAPKVKGAGGLFARVAAGALPPNVGPPVTVAEAKGLADGVRVAPALNTGPGVVDGLLLAPKAKAGCELAVGAEEPVAPNPNGLDGAGTAAAGAAAGAAFPKDC